jgi:hypothetical protein
LLTMLFNLLFMPFMTSFLSVSVSDSDISRKSRHSRILSKCEVIGAEQVDGWFM